jgi:hypothetical protein
MADVILFDDQGAIADRYRFGEESAEGHLWGMDISPGVWHTILARTQGVVCYEVNRALGLQPTTKSSPVGRRPRLILTRRHTVRYFWNLTAFKCRMASADLAGPANCRKILSLLRANLRLAMERERVALHNPENYAQIAH